MSFNVRPFAPNYGSKKEVSVAASATAAVLLVKAASEPIQVRVANRGTAEAAYRFGDSTVAAVFTTDPVLPVGGVEVVTVFPPLNGLGSAGDIYVSTIAAGSTGIMEFTPGQGV